ncbi:hypothetical protein D3C79_49010 [compost metagenome]
MPIDLLNLKPYTEKTKTPLFGLRNRLFGLTHKFFVHQTVIGGAEHGLTIVAPYEKENGHHYDIYFYDFVESRNPVAIISSGGDEVTFFYHEKDRVVKIHHTQEMLCEALAALYNSLREAALGKES